MLSMDLIENADKIYMYQKTRRREGEKIGEILPDIQ